MNEEQEKALESGHAIVKDGIVFNIDEKLWMAEEFEACMMAMDEQDVPREVDGQILTIFGRAIWMKESETGSRRS